MIDLGKPFSKDFQTLVEALNSSLQLGVEQPGQVYIIYRKPGSEDGLFRASIAGKGPVSRIAEQITGFIGVLSVPAIFLRETHYKFSQGQLVWIKCTSTDSSVLQSWYPTANSRLTVDYFYRDLPSGITDFNAGSVAGTLVRSVAREFKLLYDQMDQAYQRAFIDYAQGVGLDNVVALLGEVRKPALPAQGFVTFFLKKPPKLDVVIQSGVRVADARGRLFKVTTPGVISSTATMTENATSGGKDGTLVQVSEQIFSVDSITINGKNDSLPIDTTKNFGDDGKTITLKSAPATASLVVVYHPKSATVPVVALESGPEGNLGPGSLTVMPTPPRGVDGGVTNQLPMTGGSSAEPDDQLRERAKHKLEGLGNATLEAIRYAVLSIEGIDQVEVLDFSMDPSIPLGEIKVRFATESRDILPKVAAIVEKTRAAGIKAMVNQVAPVPITGTVYVIPETSATGAQAASAYQSLLVASLRGLGIGVPVSLRKLAALVYQVPGLADVVQMQLSALVNEPTPIVADPFLIDAGSQASPDEAGISVMPIASVKIVVGSANIDSSGKIKLSIQLLDSKSTPIDFNSLEVALLATVSNRLTGSTDPWEQVARGAGSATFKNNSASDVASFEDLAISIQAGYSYQVEVQAAAYPGILPSTALLEKK